MKHVLTPMAIHRPRTVYLLVLVATLLCGALIPLINIDTDPENMLPETQADRVFHNEVKSRFGIYDAIVVGMVNNQHPNGVFNPQSLTAIHTLSNAIIALDGVIEPDVMSLAVADNISQGAEGELRFAWMMKDSPVTQVQADEIELQVSRLPLLMDTLVSADGKAASVYVPIASKDLSYSIAQQIQNIVDGLDSNDEFHITGLPVAEDTFGVEMFRQMAISAPLAGLMIFLLMLYFFRSSVLVLAPMCVAMATVIITMGLLIGMGFTVHIMSSMIPIFLMPIAVVDSIHILSVFGDHHDSDRDVKDTVEQVIDELYKPMLFTSVTTAVGFASLLLTPIPPVQVFGAFVALGVLLAFLITIVFVPAYIVRMPQRSLAALEQIKTDQGINTPLARSLRSIGRIAFSNPGRIVLALFVVLLVSSVGVMRIQINDNPVRWFKASHPIRVADQVLNSHFAGTYDAFFVLEFSDPEQFENFQSQANGLLLEAQALGANVEELRRLVSTSRTGTDLGALINAVDDQLFSQDTAVEPLEQLMALAETVQSASKYFQSPDSLRLIEKLQQVLIDNGGVGKTNALPDVVKVVNRELVSGAEADYRIPDTSAGVAQSLLQFQSSHRPQDLWHMVTPDFRSTAIWVQLRSGDNQVMGQVVEDLNNYLTDNPLPTGVRGDWAGKTFINVVWQQEMVSGMLKSLLGAFVVVFLMMALLFRSAAFGFLAMVPLTITIVFVYGLIGWAGKDYDMPIAVLSSLTLGLSVDFAIHFIQRMRSLVAETGSFSAAAEQMFEAPARAIARNAIVIALGFTPLFFAALVPYLTVGMFMATIMVMSAIGTLVLLPALMRLFAGRLFGVELPVAGTATTSTHSNHREQNT